MQAHCTTLVVVILQPRRANILGWIPPLPHFVCIDEHDRRWSWPRVILCRCDRISLRFGEITDSGMQSEVEPGLPLFIMIL